MQGFWQFRVNINIFTFLYSPVAEAGVGRVFEERGVVGGAQHCRGRFLGSVISQSACPDRSSGLDGASWSAQRQCGVKSLQISAPWKSFAQRAPFFTAAAAATAACVPVFLRVRGCTILGSVLRLYGPDPHHSSLDDHKPAGCSVD